MIPDQGSKENLGSSIEGLKAEGAFKHSHCIHELLGHYSHKGY